MHQQTAGVVLSACNAAGPGMLRSRQSSTHATEPPAVHTCRAHPGV